MICGIYYSYLELTPQFTSTCSFITKSKKNFLDKQVDHLQLTLRQLHLTSNSTACRYSRLSSMSTWSNALRLSAASTNQMIISNSNKTTIRTTLHLMEQEVRVRIRHLLRISERIKLKPPKVELLSLYLQTVRMLLLLKQEATCLNPLLWDPFLLQWDLFLLIMKKLDK